MLAGRNVVQNFNITIFQFGYSIGSVAWTDGPSDGPDIVHQLKVLDLENGLPILGIGLM